MGWEMNTGMGMRLGIRLGLSTLFGEKRIINCIRTVAAGTGYEACSGHTTEEGCVAALGWGWQIMILT